MQILPASSPTNDTARVSDSTSSLDRYELEPDACESDLDSSAHRWREPMRSNASRKPSEAPRNAARPTIVAARDRRVILCESGLEGKAALVLMARSDCATIYEQPPAVRYVDHLGKARRHHFDFLMLLNSGRRIAVAVKPHSIATKHNLECLLKLIARQMDTSFADGVCLLTDAKMPPFLVANAELIHDARRISDHRTDGCIRKVAAALHGAATLDWIIGAAGIEGDDQAFYAAARAIGDGILVPTRRGVIDRGMTVRSANAAERTP
ncbi:hypothetical protein [Methylobacterium sp. 13MFTsu3.1M2]|uniref:hypothetical protein n=1 Tax=Methylobacterium sp. 13MFTsu3.1M2 TaxID=1502776 RepID=UPI00111493D2|nr:hypothetical protein [Methylobacterium sp. 13MFTsu3.1M2]